MIKDSINFFLKSEITIQEGILLDLPKEIKKLGYKKPFLIFDENLLSGKYFKDFEKEFFKDIERGNSLGIKIINEPTYSFLKEIFEIVSKKNFDCLVSIGGGSLIDIGKGLCLLSTNDRDPFELKGFPEGLNKPLPHITVPSVIGSGAESSYNAVFIDETEGRKLGINSRNNFPIRVLIDPNLAKFAPKKVIISSALDSLVHCVDSFGSKKSSIISRNFSKIGFVNSWKFLTQKNFKERKYFSNLAIGSIFGIYALMYSGDGPTNGFAYYFGVKDKIPHGLAGGMFLRDVMKWNYENGYSGYQEILNELNYIDHSEFFRHFDALCLNFKVPNLKSFGYKINDLEMLSKEVSKSLRGSFEGNPILFDNDSAYKVLRMQFKG